MSLEINSIKNMMYLEINQIKDMCVIYRETYKALLKIIRELNNMKKVLYSGLDDSIIKVVYFH